MLKTLRFSVVSLTLWKVVIRISSVVSGGQFRVELVSHSATRSDFNIVPRDSGDPLLFDGDIRAGNRPVVSFIVAMV